MNTLYPTGLDNETFNLLSECVKQVDSIDLAVLLEGARKHTEKARVQYDLNPLAVNAPLAEAIFQVIHQSVSAWDSIPELARPWFRGMIQYYVTVNDGDNDFNSLLGFEDDVEVVNACLRFAGMDEHCINPEDFDNVC